jgi:bacillithiol biosynthesis deacetylase BshB1
MQAVKILGFSPHPDDIEIGAAGFLLKCGAAGWTSALVDLTRGEMGSKGDCRVRAREAEEAGRILGVDVRVNLDLGDCRLADTPKNRDRLVEVIRAAQPTIVLAPAIPDPHPDHVAAHALVHTAFFLARLPRYLPGLPCHSPRALLYYFIHGVGEPTFVTDITDVMEQKRQALAAYESQFVKPELPDGYRYLATSDYLERLEYRSQLWGGWIQKKYGEAFAVEGMLEIEDFPALLEAGGGK